MPSLAIDTDTTGRGDLHYKPIHGQLFTSKKIPSYKELPTDLM
ncbi:hypothetical protein [Myxosarcina sp. GI1]|nr:hypothetical protein [Myxosarcina sp. GI1]